ncbi:hypothetical protein HID58_011618, partial [Brassica napus]
RNCVVDGARLLLRTLPNPPSQDREGSFGDSDHKVLIFKFDLFSKLWKSKNDFRTAMFERKKSPNRLMHVYDEFECSGMLTRISHALKFSVHLKFESLRMRIRRQEETKAVHLLLIVSFDDMQRAMLTFSSIALDRMLEPESTSKIWGLYARWSRIKGNLMDSKLENTIGHSILIRDSNGGNTIGDALRVTESFLVWLKINTTNRVIFYKLTESSRDLFYTVTLPKLERSLSLTLSHFLPLSGQLKRDPQDPKPYIIISPQDTVTLTVAEIDADFSHLSGKGLRHQTELRALVPELHVSSDSASILSLQITLFPNEGVCMGITSNHAALDGKTAVKFLKSWAHVFKHGAMPQDFHLPMVLDRTVVNVPAELESKIFQLPQDKAYVRSLKLPSTREIEDLVRITLGLSQENVNKLRERAKTESTRSDLLHLSTFVLTYAYVLTCVVKARGGDADRPVPFMYVADFRDRLDPPVPVSYFGNCVMPINIAGYKAKTFLGEDGFVNGVHILSDSIRYLSSRGVESIWELYEKGIKTFDPSVEKLSVGGSNRFGIYGSDFGWGRPVNTELVSLSRNILFTMSERRDDTSGVEIGICLKKCEMDAFIPLFQNGL